jgi:hypothetical protein
MMDEVEEKKDEKKIKIKLNKKTNDMNLYILAD